MVYGWNWEIASLVTLLLELLFDPCCDEDDILQNGPGLPLYTYLQRCFEADKTGLIRNLELHRL